MPARAVYIAREIPWRWPPVGLCSAQDFWGGNHGHSSPGTSQGHRHHHALGQPGHCSTSPGGDARHAAPPWQAAAITWRVRPRLLSSPLGLVPGPPKRQGWKETDVWAWAVSQRAGDNPNEGNMGKTRCGERCLENSPFQSVWAKFLPFICATECVGRPAMKGMSFQ